MLATKINNKRMLCGHRLLQQ